MGRRDAVEVPRRRLRRPVGRAARRRRSRRSRTRTRATARRDSSCCVEGLTAEEAVARLTGADDDRALRQLGIVDGEGRAATFTGDECHAWAGGRTGAGYAAQGNILVSGATVDALAETFEATTGKAARRAAARLPRRGGGGRRRQPRPAVRRLARRRARRWLRGSLRHARRPPRRRPRRPARRAASPLRAARRPVRPDASRPVAARRRRAARRARRAPRAARVTRHSPPGQAWRTSRSG